MKRTSSILLLNLLVLAAFGQKILNGQIKNHYGLGIEYVSIGIEGDTIGTISDNHGFFQLRLPYGVKGALRFSHVSYKPYVIPIQEVLNKNKLDVVLDENVRDLTDVTITYGKKNKKISSKGIKGPGTVKFTGRGGKFEAGPVVRTSTDYTITHIQIPIENVRYNECTLSITVYEIVMGKFVPVISRPIYLTLQKGGKNTLDIVPEEKIIIRKSHRYYIGVSVVNTKGEGSIEFPGYIKSGYVRNFYLGERKKIPASLGMNIFGVKVLN